MTNRSDHRAATPSSPSVTSFTETTTARHQLRHRSWSAIPRRDPTQPRFTVFRSLFFCNHRNLACRSFTGSTSFPELAEMDSEDLFLNHPRRKLFLLLDLNVCQGRAGWGRCKTHHRRTSSRRKCSVLVTVASEEAAADPSRDRPRETSSLTREDSTLSSQRIFLLGRVWPHQTFTVTSEGSAHALPFLPYLLMVALHHDTIIQTSSQENSTLSVHSAPSAFMPVQRGTGFTPQRSGFASQAR